LKKSIRSVCSHRKLVAGDKKLAAKVFLQSLSHFFQLLTQLIRCLAERFTTGLLEFPYIVLLRYTCLWNVAFFLLTFKRFLWNKLTHSCYKIFVDPNNIFKLHLKELQICSDIFSISALVNVYNSSLVWEIILYRSVNKQC